MNKNDNINLHNTLFIEILLKKVVKYHFLVYYTVALSIITPVISEHQS